MQPQGIPIQIPMAFRVGFHLVGIIGQTAPDRRTQIDPLCKC